MSVFVDYNSKFKVIWCHERNTENMYVGILGARETAKHNAGHIWEKNKNGREIHFKQINKIKIKNKFSNKIDGVWQPSLPMGIHRSGVIKTLGKNLSLYS